jgi:uncharacterized membrane protein
MRETMLIFHFLGLAMGIGVSFTHFFLGVSRAKIPAPDRKKDVIRALSLGIMGDIGITLLVVSGLFLMKPYWPTLLESGLLMTKLSLVIVLLILLTVIRINSSKAIKNQDGELPKIIGKLGKITLPLGIIIVILAVMQFH